MNRLALAIGTMALAVLTPGTAALAQSTTEAARAEGKAFGRDKARAAQTAATTAPDTNRVPNYGGLPDEADYFDDPERMAREAASQAATHTGYRTMRNSMDRRARFAPQDLDAVITRSRLLAEDPLAWTSGMAIGGTQGRCVPLPGGSASAGRYMATCNSGASGERRDATCLIGLEPVVTSDATYDYYCLPDNAPDAGKWSCHNYAGICDRVTSALVPCYELPRMPSIPCRGQNMIRVDQYRCNALVPGLAPDAVNGTRTVDTRIDDTRCLPLAGDGACMLEAETCVDATPQTRVIEGVAVTRSCWEWQRTYACLDTAPGNDCGDLEDDRACRFVREDCLAGEPCRTWERVYDCPLPDQPADPNQFICDGDIYCIDGSCETIERQANTEFKDAVVALNAMNQARREFDADTLTLFKGERSTCSSKVFGVLNCCKGKGFPLIPGISLLVALGCDREEVLLHERDAQGLCAYVGTYCSDSVLGVCLTKRKAYCCFESRLSRILQEQGRRQLNKPWGPPRTEQCLGFTIAEFARLDLSRMDFSEVYAEFTAAARLPDELEAATEIQQKIEDYYARARP